eukprot:SAG25_NODE_2643_length_1472_cov_36.564609_3_plen_125_part_00
MHLEGNTDGAALQDDDVMILLPRGLPDGGSQPWLLATLEMLGIPNDRVIHADPETRYYAEELFVPTAACLGRPSREMAERVRARCAGLVLPPPPPSCPSVRATSTGTLRRSAVCLAWLCVCFGG